jgi:hypothetical protein
MKTRFFTLICLFSVFIAFGQPAAEDAATMAANLISRTDPASFSFKTDAGSVTALSGILRSYLPPNEREDATLTESQVLAKFATNPFFGTEISAVTGGAGFRGTSFAPMEDSRKMFNLENTDVTNFADGLAKFLVARTKEELNIAFFRKFREFIDKYPEAKTLFPATTVFLGQLHSQHYTAMLPALRTAFNKDFSAFNTNLLKLRDLTETDCLSSDNGCKTRMRNLKAFIDTQAGRSVTACLLITNDLMAGQNAAEIIESLAADPLFAVLTDATDDNFANTVHFLNLISRSLRSTAPGEIWRDSADIRRLVTDQIEFKLYLGLLYAADQAYSINGHTIQFKLQDNTISLKSILETLDTNWTTSWAKFAAAFKKMGDAAAMVSLAARNVNNAADDNIESYMIQYSQYAGAFASLLKITAGFPGTNDYLSNKLKDFNADVKIFVEIIDAASSVAYDIKSKSYGALVLDSSILLGALFKDDFSYRDSFTKYATFMANIADAQNSDDVNKAIEAAVLPVGSSSVKRESQVNIAINAYLGGYAGWEKMPALASDKIASAAGLLAPVGVAFSLGNIKCKDKPDNGGKSVTLFLSVIDIGALAAYRFDESQTNLASDIEFKNIVSPGLFLYYGLGKCPISIGGGVQLSPQLRGITDSAQATLSESKEMSIRYGFSIVMDIPLFNLYTKVK